MKRVRAAWRFVRAGVVTLVLYSTWALGHLALLAAPQARQRWRRAVMRRWCAALCRAFAVRIEVVGTPPRGAVLLVANHLSYLDIPVLGACLDTAFVSKAEIADWPVIGGLARQFDTVFLMRERKRHLPQVNEQIARKLAAGTGIVVFPEGTSTRGDGVLPFRPSLLATAAEVGLDVWTASLSYRTAPGDPPASTHVCWWGDAPFVPHAWALAQLERIDALLVFAPAPERDGDRKALAEKLWRSVAARFRQVP